MIKSFNFAQLILIIALILWPFNFLVVNRSNPALWTVPETIFAPDYQAKQLILRNTYLYPNIFLARLFQNKWHIPADKFKNNLFSLLDPGYYFFSSHPREMYHNQNLVKLPFLALIFFAIGLLNLTSLKKFRLLSALFIIFLIILSLLVDFDRYNLLLWPFFCFFIFHGYRTLKQQNLLLTHLLIFSLAIITFFEYFRILVLL